MFRLLPKPWERDLHLAVVSMSCISVSKPAGQATIASVSSGLHHVAMPNNNDIKGFIHTKEPKVTGKILKVHTQTVEHGKCMETSWFSKQKSRPEFSCSFQVTFLPTALVICLLTRHHLAAEFMAPEFWNQVRPEFRYLIPHRCFLSGPALTRYIYVTCMATIYILLYLAPERGLPSWFSTLYPFHLEEYHLQVYHSCRCPCSMYDNYSSSLSFLFMAWRCAWYREMQRENLDWSIESCLAYQIHVLPMTLWKGDWTTCNTTGNKHHLQPR